jgi:ribulose-5-phosphate 4-epimerase/fuculose-1-phosphate aldolase
VTEAAARALLCEYGRSIFERGLTGGSTGNLSVRLEDGYLMTPTGASLGRLDPARLSRLDAAGRHAGGDPPTKEAALHLAMYGERPAARAVVHLHSVHAVAVSCLADVDPADVLPPVTAYYVMRVGRLPLVPFFRPGDPRLADAVRALAGRHAAVLLANHGPVVAAGSLPAAADAMEELEATARLALLLRGLPVRLLGADQVAEVRAAFPPA